MESKQPASPERSHLETSGAPADEESRNANAEIHKRFRPSRLHAISTHPLILVVVENHKYAAIITDFSMPGAGGVQLLKRVQARALPILVIVISASGDQFRDLFLEMGAFAYFSKPFRFEELESAVEQALNSLD